MAETFKEYVLQEKTKDKTILNLGCGLGQVFELMECKNHLCVDVWEPYLEQIKFRFSVIKLNIKDLSIFIDKSWDYVTAFDVVEHLEKPDAEKLLSECERIAREKVLVYTPVGFYKQEDGQVNSWGAGNPEYQKHRCGFELAEMLERGYDIKEVRAPGEAPALSCIKKLYK